MPKKSKRVAARQAQLSGRGRRARRHGPPGLVPQSPPPAPSAPATEDSEALDTAGPSAAAEAQLPTHEQAEPAATPAAPVRSRRRAATVLSPAPYFKPEMVRIGVVSAIIFAILAILTIALQ